MSDLNFSLLPWQQDVFADKTRFKVVAAGRRCGKSRLAATTLIIEALKCPQGSAVLYVSPTMGQSRQIIWDLLLDIGREVIQGSHVNNLDITMINGAKIYVRGADRPDTLRGVSLTYAVLDEVADIKPEAWEQVIRASLDPNPDIVEGEHCRWCPARSACPKKREAVAVIAKAEVDAMDSDAMNALLNMAVDAQQTIEAIQKRAFKFLESGKGLEDWTLVAKRATRKWSNEKEVMSRVEEIPGTVKRIPITPAQMEKQFPDMYQSLAELVTAESSGLTLGRKDAPNITA